MAKTRFVGDIHGKLLEYIQVIDGCEKSIQVGDFGIGFGTKGDPSFVDSMIDEVPGDHRFIRGNHDYPMDCRLSKHWIPDGVIENDVMFVGGAWSIDKDYRVEGYDWWPDEELPWTGLEFLIDMYERLEPRVMVTHTAPINIPAGPMGFRIMGNGSRTEQALQQMLDIHRPEYWIFGHWHQSFDRTIDGTRFICLKELEHIDLEI